MARVRADTLLVSRGLCESRAKAAAAIAAGGVTVNGVAVRKAAELLEDDAPIEVRQAHPWVSRGGVKLAAALDAFAIDPAGRDCLDIGASTGGFTDVLLSRGAAHVTCVDVGHSQLHPKIGDDPRVTSLEKTDARGLNSSQIGPAPSLIVVDASFISLALVLPPVLALASQGAILVALVKPQFEVGPDHVKKGVVRDEALRAQACAKIETLVKSLGWRRIGLIPSPIDGGDGNREYLLAAERS